ncbi:MAG: putative sulfate exporter family transporter [Pseudomonadota bacterium]
MIRARSKLDAIWPGLLVCGILALAAQFLADHYGAPAMLMALLLGLALHFLVEDEGRCVAGVDFAAKSVLRIGVALLGARISFDLLTSLGMSTIALIAGSIVATTAFAYLGAKLLGRGWRLAIITGGAVSICGASAAMAIASVLPRNEYSERNLTFTVFGVTLLSTVAMVLYPILADLIGLNVTETGIFLGGTIHDVAQVVGAGFTVSEAAGETATTVKLIRVTFLAPFILILVLTLRHRGLLDAEPTERPPLLPAFIIAFLLLASVNSVGAIPQWLQVQLWSVSKWSLLTAIAAVGIKTELRRILQMPSQAITLILAETAFIAALVVFAIVWIGSAA